MKKFLFPLERVRCWRAGQASLEALKLEHLCGQLAALAQEKAQVESDRETSHRQILEQTSVDATDLQALDAYQWHTRSRIGEIEKSRGALTAPIDQQRQRLMEARRQAELLERLKAKMFEEWRVAGDREQEALATELYLAKRVRRR